MTGDDKKAENKLNWYEVLCGLLLFLAVAVSLYEIVARVFFYTTYDFVIDFSVWATVWAMLLIGGPLLRENGHVSIDFLRNRLSGRSRLCLELFNITASILYGAAVTAGGIWLVQQLYSRATVFPRYFAIPKWMIELCVPLGMALFTGFALLELIRTIKRYRQ